MTLQKRVTRIDEESRYFALLNALEEIRLQMAALRVEGTAREILVSLSEVCHAEFRDRFR